MRGDAMHIHYTLHTNAAADELHALFLPSSSPLVSAQRVHCCRWMVPFFRFTFGI